jgi:hypothetical protein
MSKDITNASVHRQDRDIFSDKSPLYAREIVGIAERASNNPGDLSFDEIKELGLAVVAHLRADPRC